MYKQQNKNTNKPETKNIHWSRRDRKTRKREVTREVKLALKSTVVIETKKKKNKKNTVVQDRANGPLL